MIDVNVKKKSPGGKHRLSGLFPGTASAEQAFQACIDRGYDIGQVNVVISEGTRRELSGDDSELGTQPGRRKTEGGELGGPSGGRVGILVTVFAAMGAAVAVPALGDWGVPKQRVEQYEAAVR